MKGEFVWSFSVWWYHMATITRNLSWFFWKAARMCWAMSKLVSDCASEQDLAPLVDILRQSWWQCISQVHLKDPIKICLWTKRRQLYSGPLSWLLGVFTWSWQNKMLVSDVIPSLILSHELTVCFLKLQGHFFTSFKWKTCIIFLSKALMWPDLSNWSSVHSCNTVSGP